MDKVERVARAMCAAEGRDPDAFYETHEIEMVPWPGGGTMQQNKRVPLWSKYRGEASKFIAAADALAGTITSGG